AGRSRGLHQCADLPYPPRRHRAGARWPRFGHGGDADAVADRHHRGPLRLRAAGGEAMSTVADKASPARKSRANLADTALLALMVLAAVVAAFPLIWMVLSSLKTPGESMQVPPVWIPASPNLDAYREVAGVIDAGRSFLNSAIIATTTTIGIVVTSLMAGYVFAKYRFRGRNVLFAALIATMFLPPIVTLIPLYRLVTYMGMNASLIGVIVPNLANAFGIFLMRQFIAGVPDDLIDAARV